LADFFFSSKKMSRLSFPLTPKIGEFPSDQDKFGSWSGNYGYYPRDAVTTSPFLTEKQMKGNISKEELIANKMITTRMFTKNKSQVEFKGKPTAAPGSTTPGTATSLSSFRGFTSSSTRPVTSSQFLGKTTISDNFINYQQYLTILKDRTMNGSLEAFEKAFETYLKFAPSSSTFVHDKLGVISLFDTDLVVKDVLGNDCPDYIINRFKELGNSYAVHGEIGWKDFCVVIEQVIKAIESECIIHRELPPLIMLMNKPRTIDPNLGSLGESSTTYRDNFKDGKGGTADPVTFSSSRKEDINYEGPKEEIGFGLNKANKILYAGTSKGTYHLPGYRGHIPVNVRNERKAEHGCGKMPHPVVNDLILTQRGMGCVLGYTGKLVCVLSFFLLLTYALSCVLPF
jgi:hypothetical protein